MISLSLSPSLDYTPVLQSLGSSAVLDVLFRSRRMDEEGRVGYCAYCSCDSRLDQVTRCEWDYSNCFLMTSSQSLAASVRAAACNGIPLSFSYLNASSSPLAVIRRPVGSRVVPRHQLATAAAAIKRKCQLVCSLLLLPLLPLSDLANTTPAAAMAPRSLLLPLASASRSACLRAASRRPLRPRTARDLRPRTASATIATFQVPEVKNEPNVSTAAAGRGPVALTPPATLCQRLPRARSAAGGAGGAAEARPIGHSRGGGR